MPSRTAAVSVCNVPCVVECSAIDLRQPPMIADDLRRQADHFIDLKSLEKEVGREFVERPTRSQDDDEGSR